MNLIVDGRIVRTATGPNTEPGGSERLEPAGWDVSDLAGKTATLADRGPGDRRLGPYQRRPDRPLGPEAARDAPRRHARVDARAPLLAFPRQDRREEMPHGADRRRRDRRANSRSSWPTIPAGGPTSTSAPGEGRKAVLRVDRLAEDSTALQRVTQADDIWDASEVYREPLRGQIHFSPRRGWNNDPNGLVYSQGEYHLYFQHNPYGWDWGNMHWGHAVSRDLVHWQELPIAHLPAAVRRLGLLRQRGRGPDRTRPAGSKARMTCSSPPTRARGVASASRTRDDRGRTWTEYEGNPVVKHEGRDPRLLWHEPTKRWVMAVYDESDGKRWIAFYTSPDLKSWTFRSRIEGFFECPDLFELPVDGDPTHRKWVLTAASSEYMVGRFDGTTFRPETPKLPGHRGRGFYAAQTFSHDPAVAWCRSAGSRRTRRGCRSTRACPCR